MFFHVHVSIDAREGSMAAAQASRQSGVYNCCISGLSEICRDVRM
jgi:hypothetical protein